MTAEKGMIDLNSPSVHSVQRIFVKDLFGRYTYDLRCGSPISKSFSNLMILYGENGSGKTTILEILFHILHPARKGGHRSFLAHQIFNEVIVELGNNSRVLAFRPRKATTGNFRMTIINRGKEFSAGWVIDKDGDVELDVKSRKRETDFIQRLADFDIGLYFLKDNRKIVTTRHFAEVEREDEDVRMFTEHGHVVSHRFRTRHERQRLEGTLREAALEQTVRLTSTWATTQMLKASSKGDEDVNAIYANIVSRIGRRLASDKNRPTEGDKSRLLSDLQSLSHRASAFAKYGLVAVTNLDGLINAIREANPAAFGTMHEVVTPYVNGLRVRLKALQKVYDLIDALVNIVNNFLRDKRINFDVRSGLSILTPQGDTLAPRALLTCPPFLVQS